MWDRFPKRSGKCNGVHRGEGQGRLFTLFQESGEYLWQRRRGKPGHGPRELPLKSAEVGVPVAIREDREQEGVVHVLCKAVRLGEAQP